MCAFQDLYRGLVANNQVTTALLFFDGVKRPWKGNVMKFLNLPLSSTSPPRMFLRQSQSPLSEKISGPEMAIGAQSQVAYILEALSLFQELHSKTVSPALFAKASNVEVGNPA